MALNNISEQNQLHSPLNSNQNSNLNVSSSMASSRRNKRKNFKPRNIFHDQASESQQTNLPMKKLNLMPQARDNNGPMDLSVQGTNGADGLDHDGNGLDDLEDDEDPKDASSELPPMFSTCFAARAPTQVSKKHHPRLSYGVELSASCGTACVAPQEARLWYQTGSSTP